MQFEQLPVAVYCTHLHLAAFPLTEQQRSAGIAPSIIQRVSCLFLFQLQHLQLNEYAEQLKMLSTEGGSQNKTTTAE